MKNILIIGKNSYVGCAFKKWIEQYPDFYSVDIVSSKNKAWKDVNFSEYDTVVDFAGMAHINHITEDMRELFYSVNRDLSIEIAAWAKMNGVHHFIIFSSMNVYGDCVDNLRDRTAENPTSFYGDSKLQGDIGIRNLEDESFTVSYLRPPFVYGKGCRGNYNRISSIAKKTPVFPTYRNRKSMIYVDNLCEFLRMVIDEKKGGILTPQNKELVSTADLVREIAEIHGNKVWFTGLFNWMIKPVCKITGIARKAFADDCYAPELSDYWNYRYCVIDFRNSIIRTEKE